MVEKRSITARLAEHSPVTLRSQSRPNSTEFVRRFQPTLFRVCCAPHLNSTDAITYSCHSSSSLNFQPPSSPLYVLSFLQPSKPSTPIYNDIPPPKAVPDCHFHFAEQFVNSTKNSIANIMLSDQTDLHVSELTVNTIYCGKSVRKLRCFNDIRLTQS